MKDQEKHKASANMAIKQAGLTVDDVAVIHHLDGKRAGSVARFLNHNHHVSRRSPLAQL